jgi:predicted molibdopterin-dependent oxidoreductase YjgC
LISNYQSFSYRKKGVVQVRIETHPVLTFNRGKRMTFTYDGREIEGYEGETIAAALHAAGVQVLSHSIENHRARGFYCAIGNCSSCMMEVNGESNVRICVEKLQEGMVVRTQEGKGNLK